jgi:glutamine amidotransferase
MSVLIIDYGMSNLGSIKRAFEECGAVTEISSDPEKLQSASRIVLPGVGAFPDGMKNLRDMGLASAIHKAVIEDKIPLLGICLGMQLLADTGYEGGTSQGLGLIPGEVRRLVPDSPFIRIPHVGWNEVYKNAGNSLLANIADGSDFYFVHSYHFVPRDPAHILATTPYCGGFVSAIISDNIAGVQFHPEKSGRPGFQILKNFLEI